MISLKSSLTFLLERLSECLDPLEPSFGASMSSRSTMTMSSSSTAYGSGAPKKAVSSGTGSFKRVHTRSSTRFMTSVSFSPRGAVHTHHPGSLIRHIPAIVGWRTGEPSVLHAHGWTSRSSPGCVCSVSSTGLCPTRRWRRAQDKISESHTSAIALILVRGRLLCLVLKIPRLWLPGRSRPDHRRG